MPQLENEIWQMLISPETGAIISLVNKTTGSELIKEPRLSANFRLCVPMEDYLCNYVDGMKQKPSSIVKTNGAVEVSFEGMESEKGRLDIGLTYTVTLSDDEIRFKSCIVNRSKFPVSEFWFPRLGGLADFNENRDAALATPGYISCRHDALLFKTFPGLMSLGSEAAEMSCDYPGMMMPWWDIYDADNGQGLYMGYHDTTFRFSSWHAYLYPNNSGRPWDAWLDADEAGGLPVGLVFSHVRYPFIADGETYETGEFILRLHKGDWHTGSLYYRDWFLKHFPFDKSKSWLRNTSAWFSSIIYQPEDRVVTDYEGFGQWCSDAQKYGINCSELIGWDKGGIERDYPEYVPEEKLGGREGFRKLLKSIDSRGGKCLVFVNYNVLDSCSELYSNELKPYTHQNIFGQTPNWMTWGESTLLARKGINSRRHLLASAVPPLTGILEDHFEQLVRDGAHGFQIDKVCVGSALDFNPLNTEKPDVALCEGLVKAIAGLLDKCTAIRPDFRIASEAMQDRLLPYVDVYYRNSAGCDISPLRYVFPEWTSCQHIGTPYGFINVNGAVLTGSVICVEPQCYQSTLDHPAWRRMGEYIREVERIRSELKDIIFTGMYYDTMYATVKETISSDGAPDNAVKAVIPGEVIIPQGGGGAMAKADPGKLRYAVHGRSDPQCRAIVVVNTSDKEIDYTWQFAHRNVRTALLHSPFTPVRKVEQGQVLSIAGEGLHIVVEEIL